MEPPTEQMAHEHRDEVFFYVLQAGMIAAFALTERLPSGTDGNAQFGLRLGAAFALLVAAGFLPMLDRLGGWPLRWAVSLGSILGLGALVWIQGRTNGMHATLLIAAGAATLLPRRSGVITCAVAAIALHAGIVAASGATLAIQLQWMVIEVAAVLLAVRGVSVATSEANASLGLRTPRAYRALITAPGSAGLAIESLERRSA